jgi:hypothetical protein
MEEKNKVRTFSSFHSKPASRLGRWAAGLMGAFLILFLINTFIFMPLFSRSTTEIPLLNEVLLPIFGITMVLCGLASGVTGLLAIFRNREHSWMVWLAILPGLFMLVLLLGEFLVPH